MNEISTTLFTALQTLYQSMPLSLLWSSSSADVWEGVFCLCLQQKCRHERGISYLQRSNKFTARDRIESETIDWIYLQEKIKASVVFHWTRKLQCEWPSTPQCSWCEEEERTDDESIGRRDRQQLLCDLIHTIFRWPCVKLCSVVSIHMSVHR